MSAIKFSTAAALAAAVSLFTFPQSASASSCHDGHEEEAAKAAPATADEKVDTYPLKTCVVSGEKLGSMGDYYSYDHEGREVRFCCKMCKKDFLKDPAKYLAKLDKAASRSDDDSSDDQSSDDDSDANRDGHHAH